MSSTTPSATLAYWIGVPLAASAGIHLMVIEAAWPAHGHAAAAGTVLAVHAVAALLWSVVVLCIGRRYTGPAPVLVLPAALAILAAAYQFGPATRRSEYPAGETRTAARRAEAEIARYRSLVAKDTALAPSLVRPPLAPFAPGAAWGHLRRQLATLLAPLVFAAAHGAARRRHALRRLAQHRRLSFFTALLGALLLIRLFGDANGRIAGVTAWELLLPGFILVWAAVLNRESAKLERLRASSLWRRMRRPALYGITPAVPLLFAGLRFEPDLGTLVVLLTTLLLITVTSVRRRLWLLLGPAYAAIMLAAVVVVPRAQSRLDAVQNAAGSYQLRLFRTALIEGGWSGAGAGLGHAELAPNAVDDGPVVVAAAQFGMVGVFTMLALLTALFVSHAVAAAAAQGVFERAALLGLGLLIFLPAIWAALGALGAFPHSGVATAFFAHAGSKLIAASLGCGIVAALAQNPTTSSGGVR